MTCLNNETLEQAGFSLIVFFRFLNWNVILWLLIYWSIDLSKSYTS